MLRALGGNAKTLGFQDRPAARWVRRRGHWACSRDFGGAEDSRGPSKRDTPTTAKIYRPTADAVLLALDMFVIAPLPAMGIFVFQGFAIVALLGIIAGMLVISGHPVALAAMSVCFAANVVVFLARLFYPPWPYNIYFLAGAWLAIAVTLGAVVAQAVFRPGASPTIGLSARSYCICLSRSPLGRCSYLSG